MKIEVINLKTLEKGKEDLSNALLEDLSGGACVSRVINWQLANKRSGSAKVKEMSEISGTTKKPFRQKGTGSARQGTKRAVQMRGGRTCFGPLQREFGYSLPKKIVQKALKFVLRSKIKEGKLIILDEVHSLDISTSSLNKKLSSCGIKKGLALYKNAEKCNNFLLSLRNIKSYKPLLINAMNVYDIMKYDVLLVDRDGFENVKEVLQ
ncbi:50S ribosomal protein L4 [Pseudomonadota bacterium]